MIGTGTFSLSTLRTNYMLKISFKEFIYSVQCNEMLANAQGRVLLQKAVTLKYLESFRRGKTVSWEFIVDNLFLYRIQFRIILI